MIYIIGIVGVAFLAMCGALKLEHSRFLSQKERAAAAELVSKQEKAANATLTASIDKLKGEYQQSRQACLKTISDDDKAMAATHALLAQFERDRAEQSTMIGQLLDTARNPKPGTPDEKAARARAIVRQYAVDSLRN